MVLGCRVSNCHLTNDWNYHGSNETDKFDAVIFPLIKMMSKTAIAKAELYIPSTINWVGVGI